jgi:DnaJ domain
VRAESFADVLEAALGRVPADPAGVSMPSRRAWAAGGAPQAPAAFLFARPLTTAVSRWPAVAAATPRRPDHTFSADERRAFNRLLDLGARLEANFSADDLRREYRRLAQRYHPDRHRGGSDVEQGHFARTFADLTERHRCLRSLVAAAAMPADAVEPRH